MSRHLQRAGRIAVWVGLCAALPAVRAGLLARLAAAIVRGHARSSPSVKPLCHRNATRRLVGVALLALLIGQWTALVHSIAHAQAPAAGAVPVDADHAWGHDADTPACQLFDHLLVGQAPGEESASPAGVPAALLRAAPPASSICPGPASRAYEARGPPGA